MGFLLRSWDRYDQLGYSTEFNEALASIPKHSVLSRALHSLPHFKRDFSVANSTFRPETDEYRESVLFLVAVPIIWLLLTLLVFLIYFCVRCCQACCRRDEEKTEEEMKAKGANCCRHFWLSVFIFVCVLSVGVGLFGNEEVTSGSRSVLGSVRRIAHRIMEAQSTIKSSGQDEQDRSEAVTNIRSIIDKLDGTRAPRDEREKMKELLQRVKSDLRTKHKELAKLSQHLKNEFELGPGLGPSSGRYMQYTQHVRTGEDARWISTAGFFCWTIFILLLLIIGMARKSKCCLFAFAAFATITLVIAWTVVSAYLGVGVGVADLCSEPHVFVRDYGGYLHKDDFNRFHHLLNCSHDTSNGDRYVKELRTAIAANHDAQLTMDDLDIRMKQFMQSSSDKRRILPLMADLRNRLHLDATNARLMSATALLECRTNQNLLFDAVHGLCVNGINGLSLVLIASTVLGLTFTILVFIASCSWRNFGSNDNYSQDSEQENDPFLSGNYTTGPHYMSRRYQTESPEPASHHQHHGGRSRGQNKQTTVADVSIGSSTGSTSAARSAPAASNPTYSEHPMGATGPCGTPPLNSFSGSRTPPPPYGHSSNHHGSHHDSIYPSAPVL